MVGGVLGGLLYVLLIELHHDDNNPRAPAIATNYNFDADAEEYSLVPQADEDEAPLMEVVTRS